MSELQTAVLGGGCFWCLEPVFRDLVGVEDVVVGYAGGSTPDPSYQQVCNGATGHAEVVQIRFDPAQISFREILDVFFTIHDPTTPNRQGADVGTQYRSVVLFHTPDQQKTAQAVIAALEAEGLWNKKFVTEISALDQFYPAEDYHQQYYEKNPGAGYCRAVIAPKVAKFRQKYQHKLKSQPA